LPGSVGSAIARRPTDTPTSKPAADRTHRGSDESVNGG
jgi:hypothetical protein